MSCQRMQDLLRPYQISIAVRVSGQASTVDPAAGIEAVLHSKSANGNRARQRGLLQLLLVHLGFGREVEAPRMQVRGA
jgi:hypothetical protein